MTTAITRTAGAVTYDISPTDYFKTSEELAEDQEQREKLIETEKALVNCFKRVFASEDGAKVLDDLSTELGEHDVQFCPGQQDLRDFHLGRRSAIVYIREQIKREIK